MFFHRSFKMMLLLLALSSFGYFASSAVIPSYNNASAKNAVSDCEINPIGGITPAPLLVRSNNFVYPSRAGQTTITFTAGESIDFACPGGRLILGGVSTSLRIASASCETGGRFIVNNARYRFNEIRCSTNPASSAQFTGKTCEANGREIEIGFAVTTARFVRNMLICFNQETQSSIYSYYDLIPAINQQIRSTPRPRWTQGTGFFSSNNVNRLYTVATQRVTINNLLGLPSTSNEIIQNNNFFLSRGHLSARSDFFYAAQQNSTFQFLNALPQWQSFNGFNWQQAETDVQDYAERNNVQLRVWTGGYGITTLPHSRTGQETQLYLSVNGNRKQIPVPEIYWKVVYNPVSQRGVVLIGVNNPYKNWEQIDRFCEDRSELLPWLNWQKDNQRRGLSWACTVPAFRRIVKNFPNIEIKGFLF